MDQVAALAQVSKGTLYRYFESKEELLLATILDSYEQSLGFHAARVPDAEPSRSWAATGDVAHARPRLAAPLRGCR